MLDEARITYEEKSMDFINELKTDIDHLVRYVDYTTKKIKKLEDVISKKDNRIAECKNKISSIPVLDYKIQKLGKKHAAELSKIQ